MSKVTRMAGILCVGKSHQEAVENFRKTSTGQNAMFYVSQSGAAYVSQSGTELRDPEAPEHLLIADEALAQHAEFAAESSAKVQAKYTICIDGCGSHIVSDSAVHDCPSCSADLSEIDNDRINDYLADQMSVSNVSHGIVATGATRTAATQSFIQAIAGGTAFKALSSTGEFPVANGNAKFDPYTGVSIDSVSASSITLSESCSAEDNIDAHVYSCSASCAEPVTISSDEEPVFCAHCSAPLLDLEEDDEDGDTDLTIFSEEDIDGEDEEEEDDEEFDSESSSDDDDDEDDEDDDDDEDDEDDEDEDDEDDGFDEDDEDDDDFDSESASRKKKGVHVSTLSRTEVPDEDELEVDLDEEDEDDEDDEDEDDDQDSISSQSSVQSPEVVINRFDSLSTVIAQHGTLNPALVSLARVEGAVAAVHMFYDGAPLCRATYASVSSATGEEIAAKNFNSDNFIKAVSSSLARFGVEKTAKDFGFMSHSMDVPVDALNQRRIEAEINAATESVSETIENAVSSRTERFEAALSTALLGQTKGFWQDSNNPIADSLSSALKAVGIKDPRPMIDRAFFAHSQDFLRQSMSRAKGLMSKSEVAQNEIAESVSSAVGISRTENANVMKQVALQPVQSVSATDLLSQPAQDTATSTSSSVSDYEARLKNAFSRM